MKFSETVVKAEMIHYESHIYLRWKKGVLYILIYLEKWGASSRWSYGPNYACASVDSNRDHQEVTRPTLLYSFYHLNET